MLKAVKFQQAGLPAEAENSCRQILREKPGHADSLHLLGLIAHQAGNHQIAVDFIEKAIVANPSSPLFYCNLGIILNESGSPQIAITSLTKAIALKPDFPEAHFNLANAWHNTGQDEEAIYSYKTAIRYNPEFAKAYYNLGFILDSQNKHDEAIQSLKEVLRIKPNEYGMLNTIANAFLQRGDLQMAVKIYTQALPLRPDNVEALNNLGHTYNQLGQYKEAMFFFTKALQLASDLPEIYNNMGIALHGLGSFDEAISCFHKAIRLNPDQAKPYNSLGLTLLDQGKLQEARVSFETAIKIDFQFMEALNNLGTTLRRLRHFEMSLTCYERAMSINPELPDLYAGKGNVLQDIGRTDEAVSCFRKALELQPDYMVLSVLLFCMNYDPAAGQHDIYRMAIDWRERYSSTITRKYNHLHQQNTGQRLKIGYVSPDFKQHPVASFIMPLLAAHNQDKIEIYCYAEVRVPDETTERIKYLTSHWRSTVGMSDDEVAEQIYADKIDILVDLAGHTAHNRLRVFAYQPAPVQVSWLGYPNTTGLSEIDYRLTDAVADPEGEPEVHSEKLIRMAKGFLCYTPPGEIPEIGDSPFRKSDIITFGSFNNLPKINKDVVAAWSKILHNVSKSRLVLKCRQFDDRLAKNHYREMFDKHGISAERIDLLAPTPSVFDHLALYNKVDIGLDTFPYNGTTTTFEAILMGVPVVTFRGDRHAARVGASILTHLELTQLIAQNLEEYIAMAIFLANDNDRLAGLRRSLRGSLLSSSLCNAELFASEMEKVFYEMWTGWCGQQTDHIKNGHC